MNKVSFEFYFNQFCGGNDGVIPSDIFDKIALRAQKEVENLLCREYVSAETENEIKLCICEVAEAMFRSENAAGIKSESVDGYSVTFADKTDIRKDINRIIRCRLADSGLLYAGVE